jgi:hypothetical protein
MTQRKRREPDRDIPTYSPQTGEFDPNPADDGMWSEEEFERAHMGWRAEDEQETLLDDTTPAANLNTDVDEEELEEADDALTDMAAREMRRDQSYRTGGDDHNPGFDSDLDANAPKDADRPPKKQAGSRGQSDWH